MAPDISHQRLTHTLNEIEHRYGEGVHILANPFLSSLLTRFCARDTHQPQVTWLVRQLYGGLLQAVLNHDFPTTQSRVETRMAEFTDKGVVEGTVLDPEQAVVIVNIARAGYLPSQICFDMLNHTLNPTRVRIDHIFMERKTDAEGRVVGVDISGSKIGGPVENAVVLIPDPMGATGGSMSGAIDIYKQQVEGTPRRIVPMHLIVTPEHIKRMRNDHPDVPVYSIRVDRGLSSADVLETIPGERWDEEVGLNENQYIVPGAGGIGEILNNAFV